ncbi:TetR/AcrR family transcriptional regulator [Paenibacillus sp. 1P07SE]|uniref:TetR/AcrR family transcriptional regulator n=1 Tax=Paenibacillus sp. 1P07SE TaxID=3132209 RepID=UPI0039A4E83E
MPKLGMEPKRRAEVINAALTCISRFGMDGMTLDKVAEQAGCSKGVVTYYFKNKDELTIQAFRAFMAYFGVKIQSEINGSMTAAQMLEVTLQHILPTDDEEEDGEIQVSAADGPAAMTIPFAQQGRLFVQFFSKAMVDPSLQDVVAKSYTADLQGIARILEYGKQTGQMQVEDSYGAAYGLFAMVVGLSFFRTAQVPAPGGGDNRYIGEAYVQRFMKDEGDKGGAKNGGC